MTETARMASAVAVAVMAWIGGVFDGERRAASEWWDQSRR